MKHVIATAICAIGLVWTLPAFAQDDPMEAQRCIWRCQAEYGSNWKRYEQCTVDLCSGEPRKQSKPKAKHRKHKKPVIRNKRGDVLIRRL